MREQPSTRRKIITQAMATMAWLLFCIGSAYAQKPCTGVPAQPPTGGA